MTDGLSFGTVPGMESPREVLEMILGHLGFVFEVQEEDRAEGRVLHIRTRDPGRLIGKDGHILDDLQYLVNRIANQTEEENARVILDVEGYRENLRGELMHKVERAAQRVRQTGTPVMLDPLNSFDRRIVHNAYKDDPEVMTVSPSGPSRYKRITIQPRRRPEGARAAEAGAATIGGDRE